VCDCGNDVPACVDSFFCPYCELGYQYGRLNYNQPVMDVAMGFGALVADCVLLGGLARCVAQMDVRQKIAMRYNIQESPIENCCKVTWLPACVLAQQYREMKLRGEQCGGIFAPAPRPVLLVQSQQ